MSDFDRFNPHVAAVRSHMYKSWIRANPEIAMDRVQKFCEEAVKMGMRLHMKESEHYVDIVAAYTDKELFWDYA